MPQLNELQMQVMAVTALHAFLLDWVMRLPVGCLVRDQFETALREAEAALEAPLVVPGPETLGPGLRPALSARRGSPHLRAV